MYQTLWSPLRSNYTSTLGPWHFVFVERYFLGRSVSFVGLFSEGPFIWGTTIRMYCTVKEFFNVLLVTIPTLLYIYVSSHFWLLPCPSGSASLFHRSMKRARDVRDQLEGLMERVEITVTSNITDNVAIRKVSLQWEQKEWICIQ